MALICAPLFARLAQRFGVVDHPDGHRKLHARVIPLTGGPTVLVSVFAGCCAGLIADPLLLSKTSNDKAFLTWMLIASIVIVLVGIIDDRFGIRGRQKLAAQLLVAMLMVPSGITIHHASIFGFEIEFGDFASIVTVIWLLGAMNALNLLDGIDGLASTIGIVLSLSMAALAGVYGGRPDGLLMALVLAAALLGFLKYNFPPARMFLGDSGSMLIGLILGAVALKCSVKQYAAATLILPTAIWAIPFFDVSMAVVRRKLTGRSIYELDNNHLHHCLKRKGHGGKGVLAIVGSLCAITGIFAVGGVYLFDSAEVDTSAMTDASAVIGVATALSILVVTRSFGHSEMRLMASRFRSLFMVKNSRKTSMVRDEAVHLHGDHDWEQLWETLIGFAARFKLDSVELVVNLPSVGEEYHANWTRESTVQQHEAWRSDIPLIVSDMRVGSLRVVGAVTEGSTCEWMSEMIGGLRGFEAQLVDLIKDVRQRKLGSTDVPKTLVQRPLTPQAVSQL